MFSRSLKKQKKLRLLQQQLGEVGGQRCLLITCGDNNGALNYHFRAAGGTWTWVECESRTRELIEDLLGEPVLAVSEFHIPAESDTYDAVVSVDVHEHLPECTDFNRELARIVKPGGRVIVTTPSGERWKPVNVLKRLVGMTKHTYGHYVDGYNVSQHRLMLKEVGLDPIGSGSYSKFFTEILELGINWTYVKVLNRGGRDDSKEAEIAPHTARQLGSVSGSYRLYSALYPLLEAISSLDALLFACTGYAVAVAAQKPEPSSR
jgi:SAM-dependent methyltransferase